MHTYLFFIIGTLWVWSMSRFVTLRVANATKMLVYCVWMYLIIRVKQEALIHDLYYSIYEIRMQIEVTWIAVIGTIFANYSLATKARNWVNMNETKLLSSRGNRLQRLGIASMLLAFMYVTTSAWTTLVVHTIVHILLKVAETKLCVP